MASGGGGVGGTGAVEHLGFVGVGVEVWAMLQEECGLVCVRGASADSWCTPPLLCLGGCVDSFSFFSNDNILNYVYILVHV